MARHHRVQQADVLLTLHEIDADVVSMPGREQIELQHFQFGAEDLHHQAIALDLHELPVARHQDLRNRNRGDAVKPDLLLQALQDIRPLMSDRPYQGVGSDHVPKQRHLGFRGHVPRRREMLDGTGRRDSLAPVCGSRPVPGSLRVRLLSPAIMIDDICGRRS